MWVIKLYITIALIWLIQMANAQNAESNQNWTDQNYPDYIEKITDFGERADWSHDGNSLLFVERSFGDVYEYNIKTKKYKPLTHHFYHSGFVRALYLSSGDILLSGPTELVDGNWKEARFRKSELWILDKELKSPPVRLGEYCWEGPAASRTNLQIAWAEHHGIYPDQIRYYQLFTAEIDYSTGVPCLVSQRVVLDNSNEEVKDMVLEPQNFRPNNESELIIQAYDKSFKKGCEIMGLDLSTGELVNYSNSQGVYNEPEGIFPDGEYTLVESSRHNTSNSGVNIDLWKLKLDVGDPDWERLTWFNEGSSFKASNPVVSDDGKKIAFQVTKNNVVAGVGHGIYILNLEEMKNRKNNQ